ncbi:MAG: MFS transporter [Lysobacterales bacterium]|nr:MAG: MFS transporter [Xanthomonadales bacterium]
MRKSRSPPVTVTDSVPASGGVMRPTKVRWRILAILIFISFVSYMLRGNLSIAAPTMIVDLQLTEIQWGWVMSAFPLGYALFQFPGGLFGDHVGPRKALTLIAVAWAVLIVITSLVPGPGAASVSLILGSLILVQFLVGVAHAPIFPVLAVSIQRWFPPGNWALPNGLSSGGLTMGLAATASLLPWLMSQVGWRTSFIILAPFGLTAASLWWWYARDNPGQHKATNDAEVALISSGRAEENSAPAKQPAWLRILKNRDALLVTLSYSCMNFVFYVVFT